MNDNSEAIDITPRLGGDQVAAVKAPLEAQHQAATNCARILQYLNRRCGLGRLLAECVRHGYLDRESFDALYGKDPDVAGVVEADCLTVRQALDAWEDANDDLAAAVCGRLARGRKE